MSAQHPGTASSVQTNYPQIGTAWPMAADWKSRQSRAAAAEITAVLGASARFRNSRASIGSRSGDVPDFTAPRRGEVKHATLGTELFPVGKTSGLTPPAASGSALESGTRDPVSTCDRRRKRGAAAVAGVFLPWEWENLSFRCSGKQRGPAGGLSFLGLPLLRVVCFTRLVVTISLSARGGTSHHLGGRSSTLGFVGLLLSD